MFHHTSPMQFKNNLVVTLSCVDGSHTERRVSFTKAKRLNTNTTGIRKNANSKRTCRQQRRSTWRKTDKVHQGDWSSSFPQPLFRPSMDIEDEKNTDYEFEYGSMTNFSREIIERCALDELTTRSSSSPVPTQDFVLESPVYETSSTSFEGVVSDRSFPSLPLFNVSHDYVDLVDNQYGSMASILDEDSLFSLENSVSPTLCW